MKKILFLLLVTISSYAQTYQNPTFGTVKSMTAPTVSTTPTLGTIETNGTISKIVPNNVPITYTPINYAPSSTSIADQLAGIDTRLGQIGNVTAGVTTRVHLTGDNITVAAGTFFASNTTGKGATAAGTPQQTLSNNDDQKQYFTKDVMSVAVASLTTAPPGVYPGQLTVTSDPTPGTSKQRFTIEIYKCNNGGTPIASGITGAPVGDLGVTVVAILDSGLINVVASALTNIGLQGNLASTLTLNTGERLRYHVSAEKVGVDGGAVTMNVYYGSDYNSYYDIPVTFRASNILNDSGVSGQTVANALDNLNASIPVTYSNVVYVNNINPNSATIFDLNNPPTVNDNGLKNDVNNLYIGLDASTWVYNSTSLNYVTKIISSNTSNFYLSGTTTDAGNSKTTPIERIGSLATSKNFIVNRNPVNYGGIMIQTAGVSRWYTHADNTPETGGADGSNYRIQRFDDSGIFLGIPLEINRATGVTSLTSLSLTDGSNIFNTSLGSIAGQTGQPFIKSNKGYYVFQPSNASTPPRFYLIPSTGVSGTSSKFEMFNTNYIADGSNYNAFNIITNNVNNDINIGANRLGSAARLKTIIGGDYLGSSLTASSSRIELFTDDVIGINSQGGSITFGEKANDPFSFSIANQYTFKNPVTNQATRINIVGNGTAAGVLAYGTGSVRNASTSVIGGTSDYVISLNSTNSGTTLTDYVKLFGATGNLVIKNGSITDNGVDKLQVLGSISATSYTGGATLTGTPTAPTASVGTNTAQIATMAALQAIKPYKTWVGNLTQTLTNAPIATIYENTLGGTITWARTAMGNYSATLTGAFTSGKTFLLINNANSSTNRIFAVWQNANTIYITTVNGGTFLQIDDVLLNTSFEIRVYP